MQLASGIALAVGQAGERAHPLNIGGKLLFLNADSHHTESAVDADFAFAHLRFHLIGIKSLGQQACIQLIVVVALREGVVVSLARQFVHDLDGQVGVGHEFVVGVAQLGGDDDRLIAIIGLLRINRRTIVARQQQVFQRLGEHFIKDIVVLVLVILK